MVLNEGLVLNAEPNDLGHLCRNSHRFNRLNLKHIHNNMEWLKPPLILKKCKHFSTYSTAFFLNMLTPSQSTLISFVSLTLCSLSFIYRAVTQSSPPSFSVITLWSRLPIFFSLIIPYLLLCVFLLKPAINSFSHWSPFFRSFQSFPLSLSCLCPHFLPLLHCFLTTTFILLRFP